MAEKPIISVEVDDSAFQRFLSLFSEYTAKLDEQPEAWQKLNEVMERAGGAAQGLSEGALSGKEALALAAAGGAFRVGVDPRR